MFSTKLILPIFTFTIINSCSYGSETNTSIVPYRTYQNPCTFEEKDNNFYNTRYKKAEYFELWNVLDNYLKKNNNISEYNCNTINEFVRYCNTLCNRINFQYIMQDLPQYCINYCNVAEYKLSTPCINGLQQQYTILSERNINFEQLLNYYSNSMYSVCMSGINEIINNIKNNNKGILITISSYIDAVSENINWFQEHLLPSLDIEEGKYNIKDAIINNIKSALTFPMNGLNSLKNNIRELS